MNLGEMRTFVREAMAEDESTLPSSRIDTQIRLATLWMLQAHEWPFLNVTFLDQSADDLVNTPFRRITQVYDTKHELVITPTSTEKALFTYSGYDQGDRPAVWTINQSAAVLSGGVGLSFWPPPEKDSEARFTITGTLMAEVWPYASAGITAMPSLVHPGQRHISFPTTLHAVIVQKATGAIAHQEQITNLAQYYDAEAHTGLREAKRSLIPATSGRLVVGSDVYGIDRVGLGRRPWR